MNRILYLSFYFEPDLSAGSFRNSSLAKELASQMKFDDELIIITTQPNRYSSFKIEAPKFEQIGNVSIYRIDIPEHKSGFIDQIHSYRAYYKGAKKIYKTMGTCNLVFASSGRLFTAYLGHKAARYLDTPLYLDIRDIFADTMKDVLKNEIVKFFSLPFINWIEHTTFSNAQHINLISAGFKPYFSKYLKPTYTYFTNGIDDEFIGQIPSPINEASIKKITYAGNIGDGQGLHIIIPAAAKQLEGKFEFLIIGDGGAKNLLKDELKRLKVKNVTLLDPIKRNELKKVYKESDFFFLHLNNYDAFKKVLPSKIFELAAYDKPIIAGVGGFANSFLKENVSNLILFEPGDVLSFIEQMNGYMYKREFRQSFINKFKRSNINKEMSANILEYSK